MAGDWLKIEASTPEKEEVLAITARMGWTDPDLTVGKLFRLWRWFDQQTTNGNARRVTSTLLDRVIGVSGFCDAVREVGWLDVKNGGVTLPNFDRHNGETAKKRALTAKRVAKHKAGKGNANGNAASVSGALPREEKNLSSLREERGARQPGAKWGACPETVDKIAWGEWTNYKGGAPKKATITKLTNLLSRYPPEIQREAVDRSIANGYRGLFPEKVHEESQRGTAQGSWETAEDRRRKLDRAIAEAEGASSVETAAGNVRGQILEGVWKRAD